MDSTVAFIADHASRTVPARLSSQCANSQILKKKGENMFRWTERAILEAVGLELHNTQNIRHVLLMHLKSTKQWHTFRQQA